MSGMNPEIECQNIHPWICAYVADKHKQKTDAETGKCKRKERNKERQSDGKEEE